MHLLFVLDPRDYTASEGIEDVNEKVKPDKNKKPDIGGKTLTPEADLDPDLCTYPAFAFSRCCHDYGVTQSRSNVKFALVELWLFLTFFKLCYQDISRNLYL